MALFWLGIFDLVENGYAAPVAQRPAADLVATPILAADTRLLAIEVLSNEDMSEVGVLFSAAQDAQSPGTLSCLIGFTNAAKACAIWHDRGFPLVDATITFDEHKGRLEVFSPSFGDENAMRYEPKVFALEGVAFTRNPESTYQLATTYRQALTAPDGAQPETLIVMEEVMWEPGRSAVIDLGKTYLDLEVAPSRYPRLEPLESKKHVAFCAWSGEAKLPEPQRNQRPGRNLGRASRAATFGVPAFRFEDVDVLGFRVDLADLGRDFEQGLNNLIAPLNFHLDPSFEASAIPDFRYRCATRTLVIELLRYGRMKLMNPYPPLGDEDFQCQHELVVRLLVGRVNDDTAQAHAPAVYVPAIFVDNPWSKALGRDAQGFDKRMANFCVGPEGAHQRLLPDGRIAGGTEKTRRPLGEISLVSLMEKSGFGGGRRILELDCTPENYDNWDAFESVDLDLALGTSSLSGTRWKQTDFDDAEFRRSFARFAVSDGRKGFRSIQVSPVSRRGSLEKTWITGRFIVDDDIRIAQPAGVAGLTLHAVKRDPKEPETASAPSYWNDLCSLLGGEKARLNFTTGNWYRLQCSMDLVIDDGFDFISPSS